MSHPLSGLLIHTCTINSDDVGVFCIETISINSYDVGGFRIATISINSDDVGGSLPQQLYRLRRGVALATI